jgi:GT2 family glycosyltransferase
VADLVARLFRLREWLGEERLKGLARRIGAGYFADRSTPGTADVEFLAAVAVLARRAALDGVEGFDEAYFLYAEDVDLCSRLRRAGWRLVALPTPWATHVGGASSEGAGSLRRRRWWESHRLLVRRHWSGPRRALGLALTGAGLAVARLNENGRAWISRPA